MIPNLSSVFCGSQVAVAISDLLLLCCAAVAVPHIPGGVLLLQWGVGHGLDVLLRNEGRGLL